MKKIKENIKLFAVFLFLAIIIVAEIYFVAKRLGRSAFSSAEETGYSNTMTSENDTKQSLPSTESRSFENIESRSASGSETEETESSDIDNVLDSLREEINRMLSNKDGEWAVYLEVLSDNKSVSVEKETTCETPMIAASIVKIFLMAEVFQEISSGNIYESQVESDLFNMIAWSNNDATNALLKLIGDGNSSIGMEKVNDYMKAIDCNNSSFNRLMGESNGLQNYVSVKDCAKLLRMIYDGECVNTEASEKMMELLKQWKYGDYIPAGVPEGITIAHKGGDLYGECRGDVGIVFVDDASYIICIIANHVSSTEDADKAIVEVSYTVWQSMKEYKERKEQQ